MTETGGLAFDELPLRNSVFVAIGAASMCWETLDTAGVFNSERALQIGDKLLARIKREFDSVNRGIPYADENTLFKVHVALKEFKEFTLSDRQIADLITLMLNKGILFRERRPELTESAPVDVHKPDGYWLDTKRGIVLPSKPGDAEILGPPDYIRPEGQVLNRDDYPDLYRLYAEMGFPYGRAEEETFRVPDFRIMPPVSGDFAL